MKVAVISRRTSNEPTGTGCHQDGKHCAHNERHPQRLGIACAPSTAILAGSRRANQACGSHLKRGETEYQKDVKHVAKAYSGKLHGAQMTYQC